MLIAQLTMYPVGEGTSLSGYVREALNALKETGLNLEVGAMGTTIEAPDLETLFKAVRRAHAAMSSTGVRRIVIELKIDDRKDKPASIEAKKRAVG